MSGQKDDHEADRWVVHGERAIYESPRIQLSLVDVELPSGERFEHHVARLHQADMTVALDKRGRGCCYGGTGLYSTGGVGSFRVV